MKKTLAVTFLLLAVFAGCGKKEGDDTAKLAGSKVGQTLTNFAQGVGQGVDKQMLVDTELTEALTSQGISKTISKASTLSSQKGFTVYLLNAKDAFNGTLIAKALNAEGQEIGRAAIDVELTQDDAKYVTFKFDNEMNEQLVKKYVIGVKK